MLVLISLGLPSLGSNAAQTTPTPTIDPMEDPTVEIELEGVVTFVDATTIVLTDGTLIRVGGIPIPPEVVPGVTVRILARFEGDELFLLEIVVFAATPTMTATITPTLDPSITPTITPTVEPTASATITPTLEATVEATPEASCPEALNDHPVGQRLAATFGVSYEEIMSWKCAGFGFGEIARAYALAAESGIPVAEIFGMKTAGMGWGNIVKEIRSRTGDSGASSSIRIKGKDKKDAKGSAEGDQDGVGKGNGKDKDKDKAKGNNGNGKGNGNGNGKGKGNGKK
jgi:hypothetical protein